MSPREFGTNSEFEEDFKESSIALRNLAIEVRVSILEKKAKTLKQAITNLDYEVNETPLDEHVILDKNVKVHLTRIFGEIKQSIAFLLGIEDTNLTFGDLRFLSKLEIIEKDEEKDVEADFRTPLELGISEATLNRTNYIKAQLPFYKSLSFSSFKTAVSGICDPFEDFRTYTLQ